MTESSSLFVNLKSQGSMVTSIKRQRSFVKNKKTDIHGSIRAPPTSYNPPQSSLFSMISDLNNDFRSSPQPYHHRDLLSPRSFALIELLTWRTETRAWDRDRASFTQTTSFVFNLSPLYLALLSIDPKLLKINFLSSLFDSKLTNINFCSWYIHLNTQSQCIFQNRT